MGLIARTVALGESLSWPDVITRAAISAMVSRTDARMQMAPAEVAADFAKGMSDFPVALHTADANAQHYEVPAAFFNLVLGPQRKYSSCLYANGASTLAEAEETAPQATGEHAGLADGRDVLELGCGWGSLSLWMARHFPGSRITSVSNSNSQRAFIER